MKPLAKRLALREYVPLAAGAAMWAILGLSLGHADAVRLFAAMSFVYSIRSFCTLEVTQALADHAQSERSVYRKSRRLALLIDVVALAVCFTAVALLAIFLMIRGMDKEATMLAVGATAIPARNPGAILVAKRNRAISWRMGAAAGGLAGAILILALGLGWMAAALILALRSWFGLAFTRFFGPRRKPPSSPPANPLFHHAAAKTEASARRRLTYRVFRSFFGVLLGPFGSILARTGRSAGGIDRKVANLIPRSRPAMFLVAIATAGASVIVLLASREPSAFVGAAALARIAASAGASLLWWNYGGERIEDDEDE